MSARTAPFVPTTDLPAHADFVVVGAGPAGCAAAFELAASGAGAVLVLEAGPDYGPFDPGVWPSELLDAFDLAESHGWDYDSQDTYSDRVITFSRARVIGGCSAHNGCAAIWGHRLDYDAWAAAGNPGWATNDLIAFFEAANRQMQVRIPGPAEITPFHRLMIDSAVASAVLLVTDLNNLDEPFGIAPSPVNIVDGVRWNSSFAYLDPIRGQTNVTICGNVLVDRVIMDNGRATGVQVIHDGQVQVVNAGTVVLAGGTYNSPTVLMRSGIGPAGELASAGVETVVDLPGVGRNLHDHPSVVLRYSGSPELKTAMTDWGASNWMPEEQSIAKIRSRSCTEAFDLHIYPEGGPYANARSEWVFAVPVACMVPKSRGSIRITSPDAMAVPVIDHNYMSDPDGCDLAILVDGVSQARSMFAQALASGVIGDELAPGPDCTSATAIAEWVKQDVAHYYHPAGTCKMGPESDDTAVVGARGQVRGVDGLYVADCSVMPQVPRANTNIPAVVVGSRIGAWLAGRDSPQN